MTAQEGPRCAGLSEDHAAAPQRGYQRVAAQPDEDLQGRSCGWTTRALLASVLGAIALAGVVVQATRWPGDALSKAPPRGGEARSSVQIERSTQDVEGGFAQEARNFYNQRSLQACGFAWNTAGELEGDDFWTSYVALHSETRQLLAAGEGGRALVWQCLDDDFCAGLGDQARGLAAALYVAVLTDRALFVRWRRHGEDVTSLFGRPGVDWRAPDALEDCSEATWVHQNYDGRLMRMAKGPEPCVAIRTNQPPEWELAAVEPEGEICAFLPTQLQLENTVGCAMNFLFDFSQSSQKVADSQGLAPGERYVAVHLRFGDRVFEGDDSPSAGMVRDALRCAEAAGQDLFGSQDDSWGIFFASDSASARETALAEQIPGGPTVFAGGATPVHSDFTKDRGADELWGLWGDQLLLSHADGIVQCMDMDRHCDVSGYSQLASQVGLIQRDSLWVAMREGCGRGGDKTMNSWFDRGVDLSNCDRYMHFLREAHSIGQKTAPDRKEAIDLEVVEKAEHEGVTPWRSLY